MRICRFFSGGDFRLQKLRGIDRHAQENVSLMLVYDGRELCANRIHCEALVGKPGGSSDAPCIAGLFGLLNGGRRESERFSLLMPL